MQFPGFNLSFMQYWEQLWLDRNRLEWLQIRGWAKESCGQLGSGWKISTWKIL